jgi:tetratricopeptide (TPR) repeat protein
MPEKERLPLTHAAIQLLLEIGQPAQAETRLRGLLDDPKQAAAAQLWRLGVTIAQRRGQKARELECLERALEAEYREQPEVINLETVRQDYSRLLNHYQQLAEAMTALQLPPPADFEARVVRAADRWRALDANADSACQLAAQVLRELGQRELAWDYLTTPVGQRPGEAAPLAALARTLSSQSEAELADRAFAAAFAAEPTDAQILWDRAQGLRQAGKPTEARRLFQQLADGQWQPRFQGLQAQARWQLERR